MLRDETILEAPVTPAPIFAYRAIKSIFFASPDSSPEHDDKENVEPAMDAKPPTMKPKIALDEQTQLTPSHKRKWDRGGTALLSPTKGILRTPGLATPRAKLLKDVNVKFKSVSPEVMMIGKQNGQPSGTKIQTIPEDAGDQDAGQGVGVKSSNSTKEVPATVTAAMRSKTTVQTQSRQKQHVALPAHAPAPHTRQKVSTSAATMETLLPTQAVEAYMAQTEKEMKKLVRYGQKMREYARRKDAENEELKSMIHQLKQENEKLRRRSTTGHETTHAPDVDAGRECVRDEVDRVEAKATVKSLARTSTMQCLGDRMPKERKTSVAVAAIGGAGAAVQRQNSTSSKHKNGITSSSVAASHRTASLSMQPSQSHASRNRDGRLPRMRSDPSFAVSTGGNGTRVATHVPAGVETRPGDNLISSSGTGTGTITRLPPDRLAAARERLRRRTEARKASSGMTAGAGDENGSARNDTGDLLNVLDRTQPGSHDHKTNESQAHSRDQSQVDWLDL